MTTTLKLLFDRPCENHCRTAIVSWRFIASIQYMLRRWKYHHSIQQKNLIPNDSFSQRQNYSDLWPFQDLNTCNHLFDLILKMEYHHHKITVSFETTFYVKPVLLVIIFLHFAHNQSPIIWNKYRISSHFLLFT
jgi:hypothetical protein